jgi:hypothetical protein
MFFHSAHLTISNLLNFLFVLIYTENNINKQSFKMFSACYKIYDIYTFLVIGKVNMELQLDATIIVLLISKISSTCFGKTFAHLQERKT